MAISTIKSTAGADATAHLRVAFTIDQNGTWTADSVTRCGETVRTFPRASRYVSFSQPQCGQSLAPSDTVPEHSGHLMRAIRRLVTIAKHGRGTSETGWELLLVPENGDGF